jgi:anti-sigma factor RsiW
MDHDTVVRQKVAERYLLDELEPAARDEFEEHYFVCSECAADVHAGALFIEGSKAAFESNQSEASVWEKTTSPTKRVPATAHGAWFGWLRPAFAVPVFALLLAVIGYQDWKYRGLRQAFESPQTLAAAVVNVNVRGAEPIAVAALAGQPFGLTLNLPPGKSFSSYRLDLYSLQGQLEWSRTTPATGNDSLWLYVPGGDQVPGTLAVHGITAGGESQDLGRYPIKLQDQQ